MPNLPYKEKVEVDIEPASLILGYGIDEIDLKKREIKGWFCFQDLIEQHGKIYPNSKDYWVMKRVEQDGKIKWVIEDAKHVLGPYLFPFNLRVNNQVEDFIRGKVVSYFKQEKLENLAEEIAFFERPTIEKTSPKGKEVLLMFTKNTFDYTIPKAKIEKFKELMKERSLDLETALVVHEHGCTEIQSTKEECVSIGLLGGTIDLFMGKITKTPFETYAPEYMEELSKDKKGLVIAHPNQRGHVLETLINLGVKINSST